MTRAAVRASRWFPFAGGAATSIGNQTIAIAIITAAAQLVNAGVYVIAARSANPQAFGSVVVVLSTGLIAAGIFDFGSNIYCVRELSARRMEGSEWSARLSAKLFAASTVAVLGLLVVILTGQTRWIPAFCIGYTFAWSQTLQVAPRAARKTPVVAGIQLVERLVALSVALITYRHLHANCLWVSLLIGSIASVAISRWVAERVQEWPTRVRSKWTNPWARTLTLGTNNAISTAQNLDLNLLSVLAGSAAAGTYAAVTRWTNPMGMLASAYSQAALPVMAHGAGDREAKRRLIRSSWILAIAVITCVALIFVSRPVVVWVLGPSFVSSAPVLQILALATIPAIANQPIAMYLQAANRAGTVTLSLGIGIFVQFICLALFEPRLGALGAAYAYLSCHVAILCLLLWFCRRRNV